jgi:ectoine hydroxylase-related dioxygenase (phytanoyl-CoA dioxygenase family)
MTPKQKYLFDLTGYLHLKNVLTAEELSKTQTAIDRLLATPTNQLPSGIQRSSEGFLNGFSFDKSLQALTWHPVTQPIITELTDGKPRFNRGTLVVNTCENQKITPLHCAREDCGWQTRRYDVKDGQIHCNDFICFFYFTDVYPGDGGLVVLPGSHKSNFERPDGLFFQNLEDTDHPVHPALVNVTPKAGDVVVLSELATHGVLIWKPIDRDRRFLILRYKTQYFQDQRGAVNPFPAEVLARLSLETRELTEPASYKHIKEMVTR